MLKVEEKVTLAPFTTFHIGGPADFFIKVTSTDELVQAVDYAKDKNLPFFVLGKGANILVGDKGYRGVVIKNDCSSFSVKGSSLTAEAGANVQDIIHYTCEKGLSGFEHFAGIPSSIGGALWQNLHFLSPDRSRTVYIEEIVESAEVLKIDNVSEQAMPAGRQARMTVQKEYFHFSYDYSSLHDNKDVVLSATFNLAPKEPSEIQETIDANILWREKKHPENATMCSAGSVFKKIKGYGAGRLIEKVGLKGHQIGGAQISEKHANFIVNTGSAKASDVKELIELVQEKVKQELGLKMTPELSLVGEF